MVTKEVELPPTRETPGSIGYNVITILTTSIPLNNRRSTPIGLSMEIPPCIYCKIEEHSVLIKKQALDVSYGVVDHNSEEK